jgi:hypothetical protein
MRVRKRNEGQSATVTIVFRDDDGVATTPGTLRYRIDCLTTGRMVRDWTTLTPASSVDIPITPADNAIKSSRNATERKQLVVQTEYGTDDQAVEYVEWTVKNLQGVT